MRQGVKEESGPAAESALTSVADLAVVNVDDQEVENAGEAGSVVMVRAHCTNLER